MKAKIQITYAMPGIYPNKGLDDSLQSAMHSIGFELAGYGDDGKGNRHLTFAERELVRIPVMLGGMNMSKKINRHSVNLHRGKTEKLNKRRRDRPKRSGRKKVMPAKEGQLGVLGQVMEYIIKTTRRK